MLPLLWVVGVMAGADKARAAAHYPAMAAQAALLPAQRRRLLARPNLSAITGWQYDRRRAIAALGYLEEQARRDGDEQTAMAMWSAAYDLTTILMQHAESVIAESVDMPLADANTYRDALARLLVSRPQDAQQPQQVAA